MLIIIIAVAGILIDQLVKWWAMTVLQAAPGQSIDIIPNVFRFSYVENRGAAFGMLQGKQWFFYIATVLIVAALLVYIIKNRKKLSRFTQIALGLIFVGAIGNFIDRVWLGYVRDMFDFYLFDFWTWVFNFADACLTVAVAMILIQVLILEPREEKRKRALEAAELEKDDDEIFLNDGEVEVSKEDTVEENKND